MPYTVTDPLSLLFLWLINRLDTYVANADLMGKDVGQLDVKERPSIEGKSVLISFENWLWEMEGGKKKIGTGELVVKVTYPYYDKLNSDTPDNLKEDTIRFLALAQEVHLALEGFVPGDAEGSDMFGPLTRSWYGEDRRRPGLGVLVMRYRVNCEDNTAVTAKSKTAVTPSITIDIEVPGEA